MKKDLMKSAYKMVTSLETIKAMGQDTKLAEVLNELGYNDKFIKEITVFLMDKIKDRSEYIKEVERVAFTNYIDSLEEIKAIMDMAKGYQDMGDINLQISKENLHLEEEGENLTNEMVREKSEGDTKQA